MVLFEPYSSTSSPIYGLPNEILSCIFVDACGTHDNIICDPLHQTLPAACVISAVCRKWRMVALSLPAMWAGFTVILPHLFSGPVPSVRMVELFLGRSQSYPLSLETSIVHETHVIGGEIWETLFNQSSRFNDLSLRLDCDLELTDFPQFEERHWSALEHLRAIFEYHGQANLSTISLDRFQSALRLRSLSLDSGVVVDISKSRHFPWASLSTLTMPLTRPDHQEMLGLLPRCENLRSLTIEMDCDAVRHFEDVHSSPLTIQHLALNLRRPDIDDLPAWMLYGSLTLPSLKKFEMMSEHGDDVSVLIELCRRSEWPLVSLSLINISLGEEELFAFLSSLEHLEELIVEDPPITHNEPSCEQPLTKMVLRSLQSPCSSRPSSMGCVAAKRLSRLQLTVNKKANEENEVQDEEVRDLIMYRWFEQGSFAAKNDTASLRDVQLRFPNRKLDEGTLHVYAPLQDLRGLRFELHVSKEERAL